MFGISEVVCNMRIRGLTCQRCERIGRGRFKC